MNYQTANPTAYAAGLAYGLKPEGKYADGYTGAEIRAADEETPASIAYSAYCEGWCEGMRQAAAAAGVSVAELHKIRSGS